MPPRNFFSYILPVVAHAGAS